MKNKKVAVLGCTGSIGKNTLEVIRALKPSFKVAALACKSNTSLLGDQAREFSPEAVAATGRLDRQSESELSDLKDQRIYRGEQGLVQMLEEIEADLVVNGISGSKGLLPSVKTLQMGRTLALANKETIVMAGSLVSQLVRANGSRLIPVDSEHHGLFC